MPSIFTGTDPARAWRVGIAGVLVTALGAAASGAAPPDPGANGPWDIGNRNYEIVDASRDDRHLDLQLWYPVDPENAGGPRAFYNLFAGLGYDSEVARKRGSVAAVGGFPLVVFSHGSGGINIQSVVLMEGLASHGFIVASPNHTGNTAVDDLNADPTVTPEESALDRPQDVSFVIDHLLGRNDTPGDLFHQAIDPERIGAAGHSLGGFTALAMRAGYTSVPPDPRLNALFSIAGDTTRHTEEELGRIEVPVFFLSGTLDTSNPPSQAVRGYTLVSSESRYRADVIDATHTHFANVCDIGSTLMNAGVAMEEWATALGGAVEPLIQPYLDTCSPEALPVEEAQRIQLLYAVAFFATHVTGEAEFADFLTSEYSQNSEPGVVFVPEAPGFASGLACLAALSGLASRRARRSRRTRDGLAASGPHPQGAGQARLGSRKAQ